MSPPTVSAGKAYAAVATIALQSSIVAVLTHYSRVMPPINGHRYFPSSAILTVSIIQFSISLTMALFEISVKNTHLPATKLFGALSQSILSTDSSKSMPPALLYTLQSFLQLIALANLEPATFLCLHQTRILFSTLLTAAVSRTAIPTRQWMALVLLLVGLAVLVMPQGTASFTKLREGSSTSYWWPRSLDELSGLGSKAASQLNKQKRSATYQGIEKDTGLRYPELNTYLGLVATLCACLCSGIADTYIEKILKDYPPAELGLLSGRRGTGVWARNVQMSFFSMITAVALGICYLDNESINRAGFFAGFNSVVWSLVAFQAFGGAAVGLVTQYASSMAQGLASINSVLLTLTCSTYLFHQTITVNYLFGISIILGSRWLFASQENRMKIRLPAVNVAEFEKPSRPQTPGSLGELESMRSRSPFKDEGLSTSRPNTPVGLRHHQRSASARRSFDKRDE